MSLNCPSGGTNDRTWCVSHGRNRTQGWNLTSFRIEELAKDRDNSGSPDKWELTWTSP